MYVPLKALRYVLKVKPFTTSFSHEKDRKFTFLCFYFLDIKEEALSEFFAPCGEILNVRVIRDSTTGIGKGFGYVLFKVQFVYSLIEQQRIVQ